MNLRSHFNIITLWSDIILLKNFQSKGKSIGSEIRITVPQIRENVLNHNTICLCLRRIPKQSDDVHIITCSSGAEKLPEIQNGEQNKADTDNHTNLRPTVQKVMGSIIIENQTTAADKLDTDSDMTSKESPFPEVKTDVQNEEKIIVIQMPSDKNVTVLNNQKPDDSNEIESEWHISSKYSLTESSNCIWII